MKLIKMLDQDIGNHATDICGQQLMSGPRPLIRQFHYRGCCDSVSAAFI